MADIKELSALDIRYLLTELEELYSSRIDNIYHKDESIYIILHKSGCIKKILKIILPHFVYVTETKEEMPQKPSNFCVVLRKYLKGSRLINIEQVGFNKKCILAISDSSNIKMYWMIDKTKKSECLGYNNNSRMILSNVNKIDSIKFKAMIQQTGVEMKSKTFYRKQLNYE